MKVDGLTNDEVKSHLQVTPFNLFLFYFIIIIHFFKKSPIILVNFFIYSQKYRLHTRRPGPTPRASGPPAAQLVVLGLGGLWVPPEYAAAAPPALYGPPTTSHPPSHFYTPPSLPQEFYTRTAAPPHLQHATLQHHQMQLYKGAPSQPAQSSPESEVRGTAERSSESFEEEKSGSSSWRIEGGDNVDERINGRGSCGRRSEEGEESNRSEITLKF